MTKLNTLNKTIRTTKARITALTSQPTYNGQEYLNLQNELNSLQQQADKQMFDQSQLVLLDELNKAEDQLAYAHGIGDIDLILTISNHIAMILERMQ